MKLVKVIGKNIGGVPSFEETLAPATVFVGKNYAGKTTRLNAIRFGLLGYVPKLGKRNSDTFKLASGREMSVELHFDNGAVVKRRLFAKGESIKSEESVPDEIAKSTALGVLMDPREYLALSPQERVNYVFERATLGGDYTPNQILSNLTADLSDLLPPGEDPSEDQKAAVERLTALITSAADSAEAEGGPQTPQQYLATAIATTTLFKQEADRDVKRMVGTVQGVARIKAAEAEKASASVPEIERAAADVDAKIEGINRQKAEAEAALRASTEANAARSRIEANSDFKNLVVATSQLAEKRGILEAAMRRTSTAPGIRTLLNALNDDVERLGQELSAAKHKASDLKWGIEEQEKAAAGIAAAKVCPYCGACGEGWKAIREAELAGNLSRLKADYERAVAVREQTEVKFVEVQEKRRLLRLEADEIAKTENEVRQLDAAIRTLEGVVARGNAFADQYAALPPAVDVSGPAKLLADLAAQIAVLRTEAAVLKKSRDVAQDAQRDAQTAAKAEQQARQATVEAQTGKDALGLLKETQTEMVAAAFGPILDAANSIFGAALGWKLDYRDGEIGAWKGGLWVSHLVFSGAEEAMTYAALAVALAAGSPLKLAIIDELANVESEEGAKFSRALLAALAAGKLDQFVGAAPVAQGEGPPPWITALSESELGTVLLVSR